ncbi:hypothetical protein BKA66DRAFT_571903 [Pyrenochaeta sp. MPI-SDFR-AT-0127]|nr:hypothetical protein BKA66DRAFT_571903 [Pyrenochaeta sp. MPI-SDFR-AT-0127]
MPARESGLLARSGDGGAGAGVGEGNAKGAGMRHAQARVYSRGIVGSAKLVVVGGKRGWRLGTDPQRGYDKPQNEPPGTRILLLTLGLSSAISLFTFLPGLVLQLTIQSSLLHDTVKQMRQLLVEAANGRV